MINIFCSFYEKGKTTSYFKVDELSKRIKTNKKHFNLKIVPESKITVTEYYLKIEKKENGIFVPFKSIEGVLDKLNNMVYFNNCTFESQNILDSDGLYKCHLEFNSGGMVVYNGKDEFFIVDLKTRCPEYRIDFENSKTTNEIIELQTSPGEIDEIIFKLSLKKELEELKTLQYYFEISPDEKIIPKEFKSFTSFDDKFISPVLEPTFKENQTYLHFYLKDTNTNTSYKRIKIITKENSLSIFEIKNETKLLKNLKENFYIYFEQRFIKDIQPIISYVEDEKKHEKISEKYIGLHDKVNGNLSFDIIEYFPELVDKEFEEVYIRFKINRSEIFSNEIKISFDNEAPVVSIENLESNNYICIKDDRESFKISGTVSDRNLFYFGSNREVYKVKDYKTTIICNAKNEGEHLFLKRGEKLEEFANFGDIHVLNTRLETDNYEIVNEKYEKIDRVSFCDYAKSEEKIFFFFFDKNKMNNYEKNLIENNGGLKIKGPLLTKIIRNEFYTYNKFYILKLTINQDEKEIVEFDVGIEGFDYSFIKNITNGNSSATLVDNKRISLDFERSIIAIILNNQCRKLFIADDENTSKIVKTLVCSKVSLGIISIKKDSFLSTDKSTTFYNDYLNFSSKENIYTKPILFRDDKEISYKNYELKKISENTYSFNLEIKLLKGLNNFSLSFKDMTENKGQQPFTIENNSKNVEFSISKKNIDTAIFCEDKDKNILINSKYKNIKMKVFIKNENLKQKFNDRFIKVVRENSTTKYKVLNEADNQVCFIELENLLDNYEKIKLYYSDESEPNKTIKIKRTEKLFFESENVFVSANNVYFLNFNKNDFSDFRIFLDNDNISYEIHDSYIKLIRKNNDTFLEKVIIRVQVFDENMLFKTQEQIIEGNFYNENLVVDSYIVTNGRKVINNAIESSRFDLHIKSYESENIKEVFIKDKSEFNHKKIKKVAIYDEDKSEYIINNITTPMKPSEIEVYFDTEFLHFPMLKKIFNQNKVSYKQNKKKFIISVINEEKQISFKLKKLYDNSKCRMKEIFFYKNGKEIYKMKDIKFDTLNEFNASVTDFVFSKNNEYICKIIDYENNVFYSNFIEKINYSNDIEINLLDVNLSNLLVKEEIKKVEIEVKNSLYREYDLFLLITDESDKVERIHLKDNYINLDFLKLNEEVSITVEYSKGFIKKYSKAYNFILVEDKLKTVYCCDDLYSKIPYVQEIKMKSNLSHKMNYNNYPKILHYIDGELITIYEPKIEKTLMRFFLKKRSGKNEFVYTDNFIKKKLNSSIFEEYKKELVTFKRLETDKKTIFYTEENTYILEKKDNCLIEYKGAYKIIIETDEKSIEKFVNDDTSVTILKKWIPCNIRVFSKSGIEFEEENIKIDTYSVYSVKFKIKRKEKQRYDNNFNFKIKHKNKMILVESISCKSKLIKKHPLASSIEKYCITNGIDKWRKMTINAQNKYIKDNSLNVLNLEEAFKVIIKKITEENNE